MVMKVWDVTTENNTELIAARVPTGPKIENPRPGAKIGRPTHIFGLPEGHGWLLTVRPMFADDRFLDKV